MSPAPASIEGEWVKNVSVTSATAAIARSRARRPALRPIGVGVALVLGLTTSAVVFPGWVYDVALIPFAAIVLLCVRELVRRRAALHGRLAELVTLALAHDLFSQLQVVARYYG